jgi:hypothetical protein
MFWSTKGTTNHGEHYGNVFVCVVVRGVRCDPKLIKAKEKLPTHMSFPGNSTFPKAME